MIPLIKPYINYADVEGDFREVFESGMFTKGKHVAAFAQELADYVGAKHCVLTTSATTALWACLKLLEIGPGDEVVVSDFSFPASANVIEDLGATPVFADVCYHTYNMCRKSLEKKITKRTKAVMFVDALGNPSGLHLVKDICTAHGLPLIEDAACAIGSTERGLKVGAIADLTCFSFHPRKLMCAGEGGAITTNNDAWAETLRVKLNHGADGMRGAGLDFVDYGYNFRLTELQAAMGRKQIPMLDGIIAERQAVRAAYREALEPLGFTTHAAEEDVHHNIQSLVFTVPYGMDRDAMIMALKKDYGVETSIGTYALSAGTYFKKKYNNVQPRSQTLYQTTITVPCYRDVPVQQVIDAVVDYVKKQPRHEHRSAAQ